MPTLMQISDLHFGPKHVMHFAEILLEDIADQKPDVVVLAGDFTMRGRRGEFQAARYFLKQITIPLLTIPGNHDQPLYAPIERLTKPLKRYQDNINPQIDSTLQRHGLFIAGLNDNRPILLGGFWSWRQRKWLSIQMANAPRDYVKIVASHHHFEWGGRWRPFGFWRAERTYKFLDSLGVELVLNGHTHIPGASQTAEGIVVSRSGTATSSRTRHGAGNAYNFIEINEKEIIVEIRNYDDKTNNFRSGKSFTFLRRHSRVVSDRKVKGEE